MVAIQEEKILGVIHRLEEEDTEDRRIRSQQGKEKSQEPMLTLHPDTARLCHIMIQSIGAPRDWWKLAAHTVTPPSGWLMPRVSLEGSSPP